MTEENYRELREGDKTEVFVPLFTKHYYLPFVFGCCRHALYFEAWLRTPKMGVLPTRYFPGLFKSYVSNCIMYTLYIDATIEHSGDYVARFKGYVLYTPSSHGRFTQSRNKTVTISFFRGMWIQWCKFECSVLIKIICNNVALKHSFQCSNSNLSHYRRVYLQFLKY